MDITKNLKSVLIIDDNHEEIKDLESVLNSVGVYSKYYSPVELDGVEYKIRNHQIIFMDFSLDDSKNDIENISIIRKKLKKICNSDFGNYGLVLWTKHLENINLFKEKLSEDAKQNRYITPLFIVGLDKLPYIKQGYGKLWNDFNDELQKNKAATFFFNWRNSVEIGADKALNNIYRLVSDYSKQEKELQYILYTLARNYSGVHVENNNKYEGITHDAYKAFDEILYNDLISEQKSDSLELFGDNTPDPWQDNYEQKVSCYANLNNKMYIDENINSSQVLPGNIYIVKRGVGSLKSEKKWPVDNYTWIALELTPPCDIAQNNTSYSRLIGGFMQDCPIIKEQIKSLKNKYSKDSQFNIYPIIINSKIKWISFDFSCIYIVSKQILLNNEDYNLSFKLKKGLYAEAQRLFVAHAGRLGTSLLLP